MRARINNLLMDNATRQSRNHSRTPGFYHAMPFSLIVRLHSPEVACTRADILSYQTLFTCNCSPLLRAYIVSRNIGAAAEKRSQDSPPESPSKERKKEHRCRCYRRLAYRVSHLSGNLFASYSVLHANPRVCVSGDVVHIARAVRLLTHFSISSETTGVLRMVASRGTSCTPHIRLLSSSRRVALSTFPFLACTFYLPA